MTNDKGQLPWIVSQIFKAKNTVAVLLSKSKNDDLLINALSIELGGMRQVISNLLEKNLKNWSRGCNNIKQLGTWHVLTF